ncbi:MAG: hypothetical protein DPW09_00525 [Anaerolineae bacterium]|nr:hypothetical protein [Anaerolineae bacterium]
MELDENQRQVLSKVYNYLRKLAKEDNERTPTDESAKTQSVEAQEKANGPKPSYSKKNSRKKGISQKFPPLAQQARERIERAEASGNRELVRKHKRILKAVEGIRC